MDVESAWPRYPDYRIELVPIEGTVRVRHGDLVLAESTRSLRMEETRHVDRIYVPEEDVDWTHFTVAEGAHTICPFKGVADYWDLTAADPVESTVVWTYRDPLPEVAGIAGHVCFYQDRTRIEVEERWPSDPPGQHRTRRFPAWGDQAELTRLMDVEEVAPGRFVGPAYGPTPRDVVEGGQLLGEAVVAAAKSVPDKRVVSGYVTFSRAASFTKPVDVGVEVLRDGRGFATVAVRIDQDGTFRSGGTLMLDAGAEDLIRHDAPMPDVPGPEESEPLDMGVSGRDLRVVDGAYRPDPDLVGPPEISVWCRFRDDPGPQYLHQALLAQSTTHWTIAAAMRPHPGFGEAQAHVTLSTGVLSTAISFLDDVDVTQWLLYTNAAVSAGRGLVQGEGRVHTRDGRLVATYAVQAMVRDFAVRPAELGLDSATAM